MNKNREIVAEHALLAGYAGLLVLSTLCTSDAPPNHGLFVVQSLLWTLLALFTAAWCVGRSAPNQLWSLVDTFAVLWMAWSGVTTVAVMGIGDLRSAVNACWQTVSFSLAILIGRRLLTTPNRQRAAVLLVISLAMISACHGLYQYEVVGPAMRQEIAEHPERVLADAGMQCDVNSPEGKRFLDRAKNYEPLSSFALTNSLAGFLLPALIFVLASLGCRRQLANAQSTPPKHNAVATQVRWPLTVSIAFLAILGTCLLLTKSRTAVLALSLGLMWFAVRVRGVAWQWLAMGSGGLFLMAMLAIATGGLDWQVWSEAPKSVLYRLEYWRSTSAMIAEHPWLGVGPGNFQSVYTRYMLPQASETIADPHNFLFEICAATGWPGLLIFVGLLVVCFRSLRTLNFTEQTSVRDPGATWWLFGGSAAGLLLVPMIIQLGDVDTNYLGGLPVVWLIGLPIFMLAAAGMRASAAGNVSPETVALAILVLLVNLLAAGGISFPSIALLLALLLALLTAEQAAPAVVAEVRWELFHSSRRVAWGMLLGALPLVSLCYFTGYKTVLDARRLLSEARDVFSSGDSTLALQKANEAMQADPWDAELALTCEKYWQQIMEAVTPNFLNEAVKRNPRSARIFEQAGDSRSLKTGLYYRQAIERFPNSALLHAKLACFSYYEEYKLEIALQEAQEALRLDALNPHEDKKLANTHIKIHSSGKAVNVAQKMYEIIKALEPQP